MTEERESDRPMTAAGRRGQSSFAAELEGRKGRPTPSRDGRGPRLSLFGRLLRFLREVVAELRKVIWPTRRELSTYTTVALAFILVLVAIVTSLDYGFTKLVIALFG